MTCLFRRALAALAIVLLAAHAHADEAGWMQIQVAAATPDAPATTVALFYPTAAAPRAIAMGPFGVNVAIGGKPVEKVVGVKDPGMAMLREADAQFRVLVRTENEYTERATRQRPTALRWLVGNPDRPPAQFAGFDECYMAALVQEEEARNAKDAAVKAELMGKAIALLERATCLPVPPESARDAARADMDLAGFSRAAQAEGVRSLRRAGLEKVAAGLTTIEEVLSVLPPRE